MTAPANSRLERWKTIGEVALVLAGLATLFWGVPIWVRSEAKDVVTDEKFLAELAAKVRPTCIFNSQGAIEADNGAGEYIEDIQVKAAPAMFGFEIVIRAKKHLAYPPIIGGLDAALFPETTTRGPMHSWSFLMTPASTMNGLLLDGETHLHTNRVYRFKLEILH